MQIRRARNKFKRAVSISVACFGKGSEILPVGTGGFRGWLD